MTRPDPPAAAPERPAEIPPATTARRTPSARRAAADPAAPLPRRGRAACGRTGEPAGPGAPERRGPLGRRAPAAPGPATGPRGPVRPPAGGPPPPGSAAPTLRLLLPGAVCLATAGALRATGDTLGAGPHALITLAGALLAWCALRPCLERGPLRAPGGTGRAGVYTCWLLGYAVYGEGLLAQVITGGPDGPWPGDPAPPAGLALALVPAARCARGFAVRARRRLARSRTLDEFGAGVRPLLLGTVALFLAALLPLLHLTGPAPGGGTLLAAAALGVLLFTARLLAAHGLPGPGAAALAAACAVEAAAPALVLGARLPGLEPLARPVHALVTAGGTGAVPALACGGAAAVLLVYASRALSRASAHTGD